MKRKINTNNAGIKPTYRRQYFTLIEMLLVIFLISIVASMVSYKVKDSLDYGRAFKTQQNMQQLQHVLDFSIHDYSLPQLRKDWPKIVHQSLMGNGKNDICLDGWKRRFNVVFIEKDDVIEVHIESPRFEAYRKKYPNYFQESV